MCLDSLVFVWKRGALRRYLAVCRSHFSFSRPEFGRLAGYMAMLCDEWDEGMKNQESDIFRMIDHNYNINGPRLLPC